ncbi:MFS transporter [bacterium]|nr:MAG: MFS transporter [bacterium]
MKLNYGRTFLLGLGFLGVSAIWSIYGVFVPVFLKDKFHLSPFVLGFFLTLDNIAALLIQPPVGVWSDKIRTPIGRRMPFILIGAPISALAFCFIPIAPILPLFVLCTSTLLISMAAWRTPVVALVADVTPSPLRSQASAIISFMGGVGALIAYFGGARLSKINVAYPFWLGAVVVVIAAGLLLAFVREPKEADAQQVEVDTVQPGFWASLQIVCRDRSAFCMLLATFFLMFSYTAVEGAFTLYASSHLRLEEADSAVLLGVLSLVFIIFALPSGNLGAKFGRRNTVMAGLVGMGASLLTIFVLPVSVLTRAVFKMQIPGVGAFAVTTVALLLMFVGICWALIIVHLLPMLSDMTDNGHIGTYTGLYYLVTSMAAIAGPIVNGGIVQITNNYNNVMLLAPIASFIAVALMTQVKKGEIISRKVEKESNSI